MTEYRAIPRQYSPVEDGVSLDTAELGMKHLGLQLLPQGRQIASLLESQKTNSFGDKVPLYRRVVIQMSRRSQKTTAITATLLGRCLSIPGYRVISTAQDGTRAGQALREILMVLDSIDPDGTMGLWTTRYSNGGEAIYFENGSRWERRPPKEDAFRGAYADCLLFDEAGSYGPDVTEALVQGAIPLLDTRKMGQLVITGTPSKSRAGLLWDSLQMAEAGKSGVGALDYGMTDEDDPESEDTWWRCHPGLASGLTDIDVIRERFETWPRPRFMTEYLGYFPKAAADRAINPDDWETTLEENVLPDTDRFVLAFSCAPDASSASLVAAWRDQTGVAHVTLQDHRAGTSWLAKASHALLIKYPKVRLVYDAVGSANLDTASILERTSKVKARVTPAARKDVRAGQEGLIRMIASSDVHHPDQPGMNEAADILRWKESEAGRWFSHHMSKGDITPLSAAALAMFEFENNAQRRATIVKNAY